MSPHEREGSVEQLAMGRRAYEARRGCLECGSETAERGLVDGDDDEGWVMEGGGRGEGDTAVQNTTRAANTPCVRFCSLGFIGRWGVSAS